MKKSILLLFTYLISNIGFAQSNKSELQFDTKYYDAVNKWVALPAKDTDTINYYGFIYIDQQAGFTFDMGNTFKITENNKFIAKIPEKTNRMMYRIQPNWTEVAIIPEKKLSEMNLPSQPDWLKIYMKDSNSVSYLKNIGYFYNHVGASHNAIVPLQKGFEKDAQFEGLGFELGFAYNATQKFTEAIPILEKTLKYEPKNALLYKELGFALINTEQFERAEKIYNKGLTLSDSDFQKSEMAVNLAQTYFKLKNRSKFNKWAEITRKYAEKGSRFAQFIDYFEQNWDKK